MERSRIWPPRVHDATPGFTLQLPPSELMPEPDPERDLSGDPELVRGIRAVLKKGGVRIFKSSWFRSDV